MSGKKSDEKTSYVDEDIRVGRLTGNDGCFSLLGYLMGGEEFNQRQVTDEAVETVLYFFLWWVSRLYNLLY